MLSIIGYTAAVCGAIQLFPEILKASKTHHLQDISWMMLMLMLFSSSLWGFYGVSIHDLPLMISSSMNFTMEFVLILMKRHYELTGKPLKHFLSKKTCDKKNLNPAAETETVDSDTKGL